MIDDAPFRDIPKGVIIPASWMSWIGKVRLYVSTLSDAGTANPTGTYVGRVFFRTDLGYPVWCKTVSGNVWVDATGAVVP